MSAPVDVVKVLQSQLSWIGPCRPDGDEIDCERWDRIEAAIVATTKLIETAERMVATCHGTADFRNGVTDPTGSIDEGEVYGWDAVSSLEQAIQCAKGGAA